MKRRTLSLLLALVLALSLLPAGALAAENPAEPVPETTANEGPADAAEGPSAGLMEGVTCAVTGGSLYFDPDTGEITGCDQSVTAVKIPAKINGVSVTGIGFRAFTDCSGLGSVEIPDSVTGIGIWAFYGCTGLTRVDIPNSVTDIGDNAFYGCTGLTAVTIGKSVTGIGNNAFGGCTVLTNVEIPDSVAYFGYAAFSGCAGLTNVTIPDSVTGIRELVFSDCSGLGSVGIPDSVTSIGTSAFSGCTGLTDVYYGGSEAQWNAIEFGSMNECLTGAEIHYNSAMPADPPTGIESLQVDIGTATVTVIVRCEEGVTAGACCAFYDENGRMLRAETAALTAGGENPLSFTLPGGASDIACFVLQEDGTPLCESVERSV